MKKKFNRLHIVIFRLKFILIKLSINHLILIIILLYI